MSIKKRMSALVILMTAFSGQSSAQTFHGSFTYGSSGACLAAGKVPSDFCANAEANAAAEFDEKSPHFPTRAACEHAFSSGGCALGYVSGAISPRSKSAIYFTPRQQGFVVTVKSDRDATVIPVARGLMFSARSILQRNTRVDPKIAHQAREAYQLRATANPAGDAGGSGVSMPTGGGGPLPPPPVYDPNFDCAAVLEPSAKGDASTGCLPVPAGRR